MAQRSIYLTYTSRRRRLPRYDAGASTPFTEVVAMLIALATLVVIIATNIPLCG